MNNISLDIEATYIPHIKQQVENGALVLFTGAGFSLDAYNAVDEKIPSVGVLMEKLWNIRWPDEAFEHGTQLQDLYETVLAHHPKEVARLLEQVFTAKIENLPHWYRGLLSYPWVRVYTLNLDDLVEKVVNDIKSVRDSNTVSATTGQVAQLSDSLLDVIHLNGSVADAPDKVIFSRSQYASRIDADAFFTQFSADSITRPIVYIGSALDEGTLWEHLTARRGRGGRDGNELRPRSYLVTPSLNRSKSEILSRFNIVHLPMTGQEFYEQVLIETEESKDTGHRNLSNRGITQITNTSRVELVSDLLQSRMAPTEYLLGQEPTWNDILQGKCVPRDCFNEIWNCSEKILASTEAKSFLIITGTAGTGKSSALMWLAVKLNSEGVSAVWIDSSVRPTKRQLLEKIKRTESVGALFIDSADMYGRGLSDIISSVHAQYPRMLIAVEARSQKVDQIIRPVELNTFQAEEYTMPGVSDNDIGLILGVLERENRLGVLRGLTPERRIHSFKRKAGRQLLVAMYEATTGQRFADRAKDELSELTDTERLIYGLVCAASAYRFTLTRDEILIASGDTSNDTLNKLDGLLRRKIIVQAAVDGTRVKARHRVIADLIYNALVKTGEFQRVLKGLFMITVAKTTENTPRNARPARLLRIICSHTFLNRTVGVDIARSILSEFEYGLAWNAHYWLHRGALELSADSLDLAENFLNQAIVLNPDDLFIESEFAYLNLRKANRSPADIGSQELVDDACSSIEAIVQRSPELSAHAYHILGNQGLEWASAGIVNVVEKKEFLLYIEKKVKDGLLLNPGESYLEDISSRIHKAMLSLAVQG